MACPHPHPTPPTHKIDGKATLFPLFTYVTGYMGLLTTGTEMHPLVLRHTHSSIPLSLLPELQEKLLFIYNLQFSLYLQRLLKVESENHFLGSNLSTSYHSPVRVEERGQSRSLSPSESLSRAFHCPLASPTPLLTSLLLFQIFLTTGSPSASRAESPRKVSTEKGQKEKWERQGREPRLESREVSVLHPLHSAGVLPRV